MSKPSLIVFAKAPVAGMVKTRLMRGMSAQAAAAIYEQLLNHTLQQASAVVDANVQVWRTGDIHHRYWQQWPQLHFCEQAQGDLGQKMAWAIAQANSPAIVIGSDCLALSATYIQHAITVLNDGTDVVLGPANDGGYVLIGMNRLYPSLFENIHWSSDRVLGQTLAAVASEQLSHVLLPTLNDIDTVEDAARAGLL